MRPTTPKGTRDFSPIEMNKRNYIFDTIRTVFQRYGFRQIETPAMENLSSLMGKYGEEGDKLLFKILNSGDWASKLDDSDICERNSVKLTNKVCEKGLRYDLTVPFARYVVQHKDDITFPFKRFQIQPVWRADRPQKGRYREFYQCDADVVGSDSLVYETEMIEMMDMAFSMFDINVAIKINNRKILAGLAELIGEPDKILDITIAIDKIEKIGLDGVNKELADKGVSERAINELQPVLLLDGTNEEKLYKLKKILANNEVGKKGIEELEYVFDYIAGIHLKNQIVFDLTLARGLNYYTGAIFEVKALDVEIGSISGGGRYDNLTGIFGLNNVSGVGFSFGADRIYDVLTALDKFPKESNTTTKLMIATFDEEGMRIGRKLLYQIRHQGISAEIYPECTKMKKQIAYANANNIPYVGIIGETEIAEGKIMIKNMDRGTQSLMSINEVIDLLI